MKISKALEKKEQPLAMGLCFQMMANIDELCQFARLGQINKIQKYLQTHNVDINALNLYGESALSTATYYNHVLVVDYLLERKADPKLRLSAGHTAIHIACRLANISILNLLLSIRKDENVHEVEEQRRRREDKHIYDCLKVKDHSDLTPIHWAATHESIGKRQKLFAYLDQRMPGVLDSRYNMSWFSSWAKTHPWVIDETLSEIHSPTRRQPKLVNTDKIDRYTSEQRCSLSLINDTTPTNTTPRTSLPHEYECTPTTVSIYDNENNDKRKRISSKDEHSSQVSKLPPTPTTSRRVAFTNHVHNSRYEHHLTDEDHKSASKQLFMNSNLTAGSQKTPYFQRLSSIIRHSLSPLSDFSTHRAERAHVIPTFTYPSSPMVIENKRHDYDDTSSFTSVKRPSHNLLSNILPSTTASSSDQTSQQSTKPFAFDTSIDTRHHYDTVTCSTSEPFTQNYMDSIIENESNAFDYVCKSASTLTTANSSGAFSYNI